MEEVKRNSLRAWILAARPKTLTGAITPVMIGSALAYMDGHFQMVAGPYLLPVRRSDANCRQFYQRPLRLPQRNRPRRPAGTGTSLRTRLDFTESHAKRNHRHRPVRLSDRICAAVLCRMELIIVGLLCVLFAFLYTTGPYPLSYNGWAMFWSSYFSDSSPWAERTTCRR